MNSIRLPFCFSNFTQNIDFTISLYAGLIDKYYVLFILHARFQLKRINIKKRLHYPQLTAITWTTHLSSQRRRKSIRMNNLQGASLVKDSCRNHLTLWSFISQVHTSTLYLLLLE